MRLGVHVPIAGGLPLALDRAQTLRCTTMQIFSRSPRGGPAPKLSQEDADAFHKRRVDLGIAPLAVHAPYILNLATPDKKTWGFSHALYLDEYKRVTRLRAQFLVTHVGSPRGADESVGIAQVAEAINRVLDEVPSETMILLENTAGSGQGLGSKFEQLTAIRDGVRDRARVGICLDTAHLFASGYPIHTPEGLERTIQAFDREVGLPLVKFIHLNDSKVPFNAKVDRHWHIGYGHIGREAFARILNHPALSQLNFVLETPKESDLEDQRNLAMVRSLATRPDIAAEAPPPFPEFALDACAPPPNATPISAKPKARRRVAS